MTVPTNTMPQPPVGFGRDNAAVRLGVAVAASLGLNVLLVMGAGRLAESMSQRAASDTERNAIIEVVRVTRPTPAPTATPAAAIATPVATPVPTPTPAVATPRAIATSRPVSTPRPQIVPPRINRAETAQRDVQRTIPTPATTVAPTQTNTTQRQTAPNRPILAKGNTLTEPALRRSAARIAPSAADAAPGSRTTAAPAATARPTAAEVAGRTGDTPAPLASATTTPVEAVGPTPGTARLRNTSGGSVGKVGARNTVVTMNAKAASATVSSTDFYLPSTGSVRSGVATARQGRGTAGEVTSIAGDPTIISATEEAQVLAAPGPNRRLVGVGGAPTLRGTIGSTVGTLAPKAGSGAGVQAGIGGAAGAAGGTGRGASGVDVRNGGTVGGRDGTIAGVGGGGAGVATEGVGVGNGNGRGNTLNGTGSGNGNGPVARKNGPVGGGAGGTRPGSGAGSVVGVPDGVPGGTVATGGTKVRGTGGTASGRTEGGAPKAQESERAAKVDDTVKKVDERAPKKVTVSDDSSEDQVGTNATQIGAKAVSKGSLDNFITDAMRRRKIDGNVRFRVTVEASGRASVELLDGSGDSEVDRAVTSYLKSWRWEPAKQDGKPVQSTLTQRIRLSQN